MLSKETKVDVKNKENKTACFIEIEGLLNSLELISDLPGLGAEEQQGQGSWERRAGERGWQVGAACALGLAGLTRECYSLQRGGGQLVTAGQGGRGLRDFGTPASVPRRSCSWIVSICHHLYHSWVQFQSSASPRPSLSPARAGQEPNGIQWIVRISQPQVFSSELNSELSSLCPTPIPQECHSISLKDGQSCLPGGRE